MMQPPRSSALCRSRLLRPTRRTWWLRGSSNLLGILTLRRCRERRPAPTSPGSATFTIEGATRRFGLLLEPKLLDEAKQQLRTDLLCYCDQDTLGLVKLVDRLLELARGSGVLR